MNSNIKNDVIQYIVDHTKLGYYELFLDSSDQTYLSFLSKNKIMQNWPLRSKAVEAHLMQLANDQHGQIMTDRTVKGCIELLNSRAMIHGLIQPTAVRVGYHEDAYYLDLCNAQWQYVKITDQGWEVVNQCPIKFLRNENLRPLPVPNKEGDLNALWPSLNIDDNDKLLVTAWLLECLRPNTQMPLLEINGFKGSGKSQTTQFLRNVFDPNKASLRQQPKNVDDLYISSQNSALLVFENATYLSSAIQDAMCQLVTGSGYSKRKLYTDSDETVLSVRKPLVINGISKLVTRTDLIERSVFCLLPDIPTSKRKAESEFLIEFEHKHASILGGLLNVFCQVLKALPHCQPKELPRLADFGRLGQVLCDINHETTPFFNLLKANQEKAIFEALDDQPTLQVLLSYMQDKERFHGTFKALLDRLKQFDKSTNIVSTPRKLSSLLRTWQSELHRAGLTMVIDPQRHNDGYSLTITISDPDVHDVHNSKGAGDNADIEYSDSTVREFFEEKPIIKQH